MDKVYRPDIARLGGGRPILTQLRLDLTLRRLVAQIQANFIVDSNASLDGLSDILTSRVLL